ETSAAKAADRMLSIVPPLTSFFCLTRRLIFHKLDVDRRQVELKPRDKPSSEFFREIEQVVWRRGVHMRDENPVGVGDLDIAALGPCFVLEPGPRLVAPVPRIRTAYTRSKELVHVTAGLRYCLKHQHLWPPEFRSTTVSYLARTR